MASSNMKYPCPSTVNASDFVSLKLWSIEFRSPTYEPWKYQVLCLIESQGLLGFIDGTIPPPPEKIADGEEAERPNPEYIDWRRSDVLVKGWILGSISGLDVLSHVANLKTAREVWLELETKFSTPLPDPIWSNKSEGQKDSNEYLELHRAAVKGDWNKAKGILKQDKGACKVGLDFQKSTALHVAVGTGKAIHFVRELVKFMSDEDIVQGTIHGNTALAIAAAVGNKDAAIILVNRKPILLYTTNTYGNFPVQIAALYAHRDMLEYFLDVTKDDATISDKNPYADLPGLMLLVRAINADFFDIALYLVGKYPHLARVKLPEVGSALGCLARKKSAFSSGRSFNLWERFLFSCGVVEKTFMNPNFGAPKKLGHDIESIQPVEDKFWKVPWKFIQVYLVPQIIKRANNKLLMNQQALELVTKLCKELGSLSFKEAYEVYGDAIMTAAELGVHEVVEVIVETIPTAIYSERSGYQTIFHVAIRNRSESVFNLVYQLSDHKYIFSNINDGWGNNLLHAAAYLAPPHKLNAISGAALQMQREIQWYKEVEKFVYPYSRETLNTNKQSPKMLFTDQHKMLKEAGEKWMKDTANSCTIAAALIATVMFAAAITVPGGNENVTGLPFFSNNFTFLVFAFSDAVSLFTSATSLLMFLSILTSRYSEEDFLHDLPKRLIIGLGTLFLSITFMMVSFSATLYLVFCKKKAWVLIPVAAMACLPVSSFVLLQYPLLIDLFYSTYGTSIFGKKSDHPFY